jgi:hypothetical protein
MEQVACRVNMSIVSLPQRAARALRLLETGRAVVLSQALDTRPPPGSSSGGKRRNHGPFRRMILLQPNEADSRLWYSQVRTEDLTSKPCAPVIRLSGYARLRINRPAASSRHQRVPDALLVDELLAQDVCVPAVLGEFAQHVEIYPAQRERAAPVAVDQVVEPQGCCRAAG